MALVITWAEDSGPATGTPAHGTTRTGFGGSSPAATDVNWKNIDDCTNNGGTPYSAAPIYFGNNSFTKYQYLYLSGSFTQISAGLFAHTSGAFGTGLTLKGTVTSTYATPATAANAALTTDMTAPISIGSGLAVNFSTTGPQAGSPTSTLSAPGYTQYFATQLQVAASPVPAFGDAGPVSLIFQYTIS